MKFCSNSESKLNEIFHPDIYQSAFIYHLFLLDMLYNGDALQSKNEFDLVYSYSCVCYHI